jgi:nitronate monooxygenase
MRTLLTEVLQLDYPVIQAPMAFAAGGNLAASVARGGGLGLIGGGYGDLEWIREQYQIAGDPRVGVGLITWALDNNPSLLDDVLALEPSAVFLSFGDPGPFADKIRDAGVPLICQVQTMKDAQRAIDAGADIVVAQGAEAGGHGESRGLLPLLTELADHIARHNLKIPLVAAGGISDGRGLVAALALGADGIVMGTRYWASPEALVYPGLQSEVLTSTGDETLRSHVFDVIRGLKWPTRYTTRSYKNAFLEAWHEKIDTLRNDAETVRASWGAALEKRDTSVMPAFVGEGIGSIHEVVPASEIAKDVVREAQLILKGRKLSGN